MATKVAGPDTPSGDHSAMAPYWTMVQHMLEGPSAMRRHAKRYIKKFPKESKGNYDYRCENSKFVNIFRDIVENLSSKPFAKPVTVKEGTVSEQLRELLDNIDGSGNNLHNFASHAFFNGIANALHYIWVDHTKVPKGANLAEEKKLGSRPYWVHLQANQVVSAHMAFVEGREQFIDVRFLAPTVVREGYAEVLKERVYEVVRPKVGNTYGKPMWNLWEKRVKPNGEEEWISIEKGELSIGFIPLVPFVIGRRKGTAWQFNPPMEDAAHLQIEHFLQETNLKMAKELTCFPMLSASGLSAPKDDKGKAVEVPTGPGVILWAPAAKDGSVGSWSFVEPSATSLEFLSKQIDKTEEQLRELGRQPLTAQSGNLTNITAGVAASKGNSAVQAWGLNLKNALELALNYTGAWLQQADIKPEVNVYTDFGIEMGDGTSMGRIIEMRRNGDLDRDTLWDEAQRRGELSADFDREAARQRLADEAPTDPSEDDIEATVVPARRPQRTPPNNDPPSDQRKAA